MIAVPTKRDTNGPTKLCTLIQAHESQSLSLHCVWVDQRWRSGSVIHRSVPRSLPKKMQVNQLLTYLREMLRRDQNAQSQIFGGLSESMKCTVEKTLLLQMLQLRRATLLGAVSL